LLQSVNKNQRYGKNKSGFVFWFTEYNKTEKKFMA